MPNHHPPHIYLDNTWYFITASIHGKHRWLQPADYKDFVCDQLKALVTEFHVQLAAWVILDNHYHILGKSHAGADFARLFGRLHGRTAFELKRTRWKTRTAGLAQLLGYVHSYGGGLLDALQLHSSQSR